MAMGKVRAADFPETESHCLRQELLCALRCIQAEQDFTLFLDLLTASEQLMIARRVHIAKRLLAGEDTRTIRQTCKVGQATIQAVDRWLRARCGDYRNLFPGLYEDLRTRRKNKQRKQPIIPYTFRWVRRKYPLHFLLFNILLDDIDWGDRKDKHPPRPYRPWRRKQKLIRRHSMY